MKGTAERISTMVHSLTEQAGHRLQSTFCRNTGRPCNVLSLARSKLEHIDVTQSCSTSKDLCEYSWRSSCSATAACQWRLVAAKLGSSRTTKASTLVQLLVRNISLKETRNLCDVSLQQLGSAVTPGCGTRRAQDASQVLATRLTHLAGVGSQPPVLLKLTGDSKPVDQHRPGIRRAGEGCIPDGLVEGAASVHHHVHLVALGKRGQRGEQDAHVGHDACNQQLLAACGLQGGGRAGGREEQQQQRCTHWGNRGATSSALLLHGTAPS